MAISLCAGIVALLKLRYRLHAVKPLLQILQTVPMARQYSISIRCRRRIVLHTDTSNMVCKKQNFSNKFHGRNHYQYCHCKTFTKKQQYMPTNQHHSRALQVFVCFLFVLITVQPCVAQDAAPDSLLQSSRLYQKGKKNITFGATFLGIGVVATIVGLVMTEEEPSGWDFGPSDKEAAYFFGAVFGTIGLLKIIQGGVRIQKAKSQFGMVTYQRLPGSKAQMPALRVQWCFGDVAATKKVGNSGAVRW